MFYATITICLAAVGMCNMDNSIWSMMSDPVFSTITICHQEALNYLHIVNFENILEQGKDYIVNIECMGSV